MALDEQQKEQKSSRHQGPWRDKEPNKKEPKDEPRRGRGHFGGRPIEAEGHQKHNKKEPKGDEQQKEQKPKAPWKSTAPTDDQISDDSEDWSRANWNISHPLTIALRYFPFYYSKVTIGEVSHRTGISMEDMMTAVKKAQRKGDKQKIFNVWRAQADEYWEVQAIKPMKEGSGSNSTRIRGSTGAATRERQQAQQQGSCSNSTRSWRHERAAGHAADEEPPPRRGQIQRLLAMPVQALQAGERSSSSSWREEPQQAAATGKQASMKELFQRMSDHQRDQERDGDEQQKELDHQRDQEREGDMIAARLALRRARAEGRRPQ